MTPGGGQDGSQGQDTGGGEGRVSCGVQRHGAVTGDDALAQINMAYRKFTH